MWQVFDSVFCINLVDRHDRFLECKKQLATFPALSKKLEFYHPTRHPTNPAQGVYESHQTVMQESLARGDQWCLIFEDDVMIDTWFDPAILEQSVEFIKHSPDCDLFFFGCHIHVQDQSTERVAPNIYRVRAIQTHAYAVSRKFMERFCKVPFEFLGEPIDHVFRLNKNAYTSSPNYFFQKPDDKSDVNPNVSLAPWRTKLQNLYACHINLPVQTLRVLVLVLVIIFLLIVILHARFKNI
jgi:hypothetical protein